MSWTFSVFLACRLRYYRYQLSDCP